MLFNGIVVVIVFVKGAAAVERNGGVKRRRKTKDKRTNIFEINKLKENFMRR